MKQSFKQSWIDLCAPYNAAQELYVSHGRHLPNYMIRYLGHIVRRIFLLYMIFNYQFLVIFLCHLRPNATPTQLANYLCQKNVS